ncbi:ATP synthase F1 subunit gamma [Buchnera aphidicola]|uniref:ATP synthase gamma chain n=1 Tax=Buchnera aphidicola (Stegophylla sp.) TaxID=2315800 RepID=A0A4D6YIK4_9GAMM|nr:ATP synthase F1 subunit gamma [Buchnera aphidicola (Stegophylla sp.)]QCI26211.1 ATP synthase F1 subunit gamma [Buchnera aphidicola (Stegophylla sp.)]
MISIKNLKIKINSISNTQKITRTMEMIAISKMKKLKKELLFIQPYSKVINTIMEHVAQSNIKYKHFFFQSKKIIKNIGIIIISTNKGLCGNLNANIFKMVNKIIKKNSYSHIQYHLYIIGLKGLLFFQRLKFPNIVKILELTDNIKKSKIKNFVKNILKKCKKNKIDKLFIISNKFNNEISHTLNYQQLFPYNTIKKTQNILYKNYWDYLYEPKYTCVIKVLLNKYITFQIFQYLLSNIVSEQSARMLAMKTASDNSNNIIKELQVNYNKKRQFNITQELIEIISGASMISENS